MKILYLIPWPLQDKISEDLTSVVSSTFGYYTLKNKGVDIAWHSHSRHSWIYIFLKKISLPQLNQIFCQFSLVGKTKGYDIIYIAFDMHLLPLAILKMIGIIKTPIFVLSHFSYSTKFSHNRWKRLYISIERKIVYRAFEKISFACETLLDIAKRDYPVPNRHWNIANWGANLQFYDRGIFNMPPLEQYFVAAGGMNRDYRTLVESFRKTPKASLKIFAKYKDYTHDIPQNVTFENLMRNCSYNDAYIMLRYHYYNSIAILLPIDYINDVPNGATVLVEALAMGKPIVITEAETNYIDVEKEECGLTVKRHDVEGWMNAINYLLQHPEERKRMGERSFQLAKEKYNDELFSHNILKQLEDVVYKQ